MGNLNGFLKKNKKIKENTKYAATKSLVDEEGKPLLWTLKPLTTRENDAIRDDCTIEVPISGRKGQFRSKLDISKYMAKLIVSSVVEPNLNDKELQDSYGVMSAEELIKEMVDDPGEYSELCAFIQEYNGFSETIDEKVVEAKN